MKYVIIIQVQVFDSGSHKAQHYIHRISGTFEIHTPENVVNVENLTDLAMGRRPELKSVESVLFTTLLHLAPEIFDFCRDRHRAAQDAHGVGETPPH